MKAVGASSLLDVWEAGREERQQRRALLLIAAAWPEDTADHLASLTVGERDARLLRLRRSAFGPELECLAECPACRESLEFRGAVSDLLPASPDGGGEGASLSVDDYEIIFRLPRAADVLELEGCRDAETGRRLLLERCLTEMRRRGERVEAEELPEGVLSAVEAAMQRADPASCIRLDLRCPTCGHGWTSTFDIVSYLWTEIDTWARRTLREVHVLASAYGWTEGEILGMSAGRRAAYVNLISA